VRCGAARVQVLRAGRHGLDGAVLASYEPEGFREAEGMIAVGLEAGLRLGAVDAIGEVAFGQDPEGDDRQLNVRAAALAGDGGLRYGGAGRLRVDVLSDDVKRVGRGEADLEADAGPVASVTWNHVVLSGQVGIAVVKRSTTWTTSRSARSGPWRSARCSRAAAGR